MSDVELSAVLEELGEIARWWKSDRRELVSDLTRARHECQDMKNLGTNRNITKGDACVIVS